MVEVKLYPSIHKVETKQVKLFWNYTGTWKSLEKHELNSTILNFLYQLLKKKIASAHYYPSSGLELDFFIFFCDQPTNQNFVDSSH